MRSLLGAIVLLTTGTGFLSTLIGVRLERSGESTLIIGMVATAYYGGLTIGAVLAAAVFRRLGHVRAFAISVSLLSVTLLTYALWENPLLWMGLRLADGFSLAVIFVCIESWLNERADNDSRGGVLAAYMICFYVGQAAGQYLLSFDEHGTFRPFLAASMLVSLAAVPVLLTDMAAPTNSNATPFSLRRLYVRSPLGVVGVVLSGAMLGAFYGFAAVSLQRIGLDIAETAMFVAAASMGGILFQWPLGRLSDCYDRGWVINFTFAGTALACGGLAITEGNGAQLLALGTVFGGLNSALYPLCAAHTNDRLGGEERVSAAGGLVLLYSIGATVGPLCGSTAMALPLGNGLFAFIAACAVAALTFGLWRQVSAPSVPDEVRRPFRGLPGIGSVVVLLDPEPMKDDTPGAR